jgi:phospholipid/cholesterol/gamma-HCH transport system substrate-binding protein
MKIANETKIGIIGVVAVAILILGFNFLKGKSLFSKSHSVFAKYHNVQGLANSNPVLINGMQVGTVYSITPTDKNMKEILVNINLTKDVNIPINSVALIKPSLLGTTSIDIKLGDAPTYIGKNDTIMTDASPGVFNEALAKVDPVLYQVTKAVKSIDSVLVAVNSILDPNAKNNISQMLGNLNKTTANLVGTSASLQELLNTQTGALAKTLNNLNAFTTNLNGNNEKINSMLGNLDKTSANLAALDLKATLAKIDAAMSDLKGIVGKVNSNNGTLGLLLNDTKLYNNLTATTNKLNLLIDDLKTNPKRYISLSIFGKKNTSPGLSVPLPDTVNAPYLPKK